MSLNKQFKRKLQQEEIEKNQANEILRREQRALTEAMNVVQDQLGNISYQICHLQFMKATLAHEDNAEILQEFDSALHILNHRKNHRVNELLKISKLTETREAKLKSELKNDNTQEPPQEPENDKPVEDAPNRLVTVDCVNEPVNISGKQYLATIAQSQELE